MSLFWRVVMVSQHYVFRFFSESVYRSGGEPERYTKHNPLIRNEIMSERIIPRFKFIFVCIVAVFFCGAQALVNGIVGFQQDENWLSCILSATLFFCGELTMILLVHRVAGKNLLKFISMISILGFCFMSIFSSASFFVGAQFEKDNQPILLAKKQMELLEKSIDSMPENWISKRREALEKMDKLRVETNKIAEKSGGYATGSTAIFHYLSKFFDCSVQEITLIVRLIFSITFLFGSISLTSFALSQKQKTETKPFLPDRRYNNNVYPITEFRTVPRVRDGEKKEEKKPEQEQKEKKKPVVDYDTTRKMVADSRLKPSVRALKEIGLGTDVAAGYLRKMKAEGVLKKAGQGYKRSDNNV